MQAPTAGLFHVLCHFVSPFFGLFFLFLSFFSPPFPSHFTAQGICLLQPCSVAVSIVMAALQAGSEAAAISDQAG